MNCTVMIGHIATQMLQIHTRRLLSVNIDKVLLAVLVLGPFLTCWPISMASMDLPDQRISLTSSVILVDSGDAYVRPVRGKGLICLPHRD